MPRLVADLEELPLVRGQLPRRPRHPLLVRRVGEEGAVAAAAVVRPVRQDAPAAAGEDAGPPRAEPGQVGPHQVLGVGRVGELHPLPGEVQPHLAQERQRSRRPRYGTRRGGICSPGLGGGVILRRPTWLGSAGWDDIRGPTREGRPRRLLARPAERGPVYPTPPRRTCRQPDRSPRPASRAAGPRGAGRWRTPGPGASTGGRGPAASRRSSTGRRRVRRRRGGGVPAVRRERAADLRPVPEPAPEPGEGGGGPGPPGPIWSPLRPPPTPARIGVVPRPVAADALGDRSRDGHEHAGCAGRIPPTPARIGVVPRRTRGCRGRTRAAGCAGPIPPTPARGCDRPGSPTRAPGWPGSASRGGWTRAPGCRRVRRAPTPAGLSGSASAGDDRLAAAAAGSGGLQLAGLGRLGSSETGSRLRRPDPATPVRGCGRRGRRTPVRACRGSVSRGSPTGPVCRGSGRRVWPTPAPASPARGAELPRLRPPGGADAGPSRLGQSRVTDSGSELSPAGHGLECRAVAAAVRRGSPTPGQGCPAWAVRGHRLRRRVVAARSAGRRRLRSRVVAARSAAGHRLAVRGLSGGLAASRGS